MKNTVRRSKANKKQDLGKEGSDSDKKAKKSSGYKDKKGKQRSDPFIGTWDEAEEF